MYCNLQQAACWTMLAVLARSGWLGLAFLISLECVIAFGPLVFCSVASLQGEVVGEFDSSSSRNMCDIMWFSFEPFLMTPKYRHRVRFNWPSLWQDLQHHQ